MGLSALENQRLSKISTTAYSTIRRLNDKASVLWGEGFNNDALRAKANGLLAQADATYKKEVLYRNF